MLGYLFLLLIPLAAIGFSGGSGDDDDDDVDPAPDAGFIRDATGDADTRSGGPLNDLLFGRGGDDTLNGADGDDILVGEVGDDVLRGGEGDDLLFGGAGEDLLVGGGGEGDDLLFGGDSDDRLVGDGGDDILVGGGGGDMFDGAAGDDLLIGLEPGAALGQALGSATEATDELRAGLEARFGSTVSDGQIDRVLGGLSLGTETPGGVDSLRGAEGADTLIGDAGDFLAGGFGEDAFGVYVTDLADDPVTLADYAASVEGIEIVLGQGVAQTPVSAVARGTGSALVMGGVDIVLLPAVAVGNVNLAQVTVRSL